MPAKRSHRRSWRDAHPEVRVSPEHQALLERAALQGQTLSEFLIVGAQAAAEEVTGSCAVITLTARDTTVLVEALLNPPSPNDSLRVALQRHRDLVKPRA